MEHKVYFKEYIHLLTEDRNHLGLSSIVYRDVIFSAISKFVPINILHDDFTYQKESKLVAL